MSPLRFHRHQLALVGYSNSGKTTLLQAVLRQLHAQHYRVGVVKHDAHQLELDQPGKDSHQLWHAGASSLLVHNREEQFLRHHQPLSNPETYFNHCDFVLIEGHKHATFPKMILLNEDESIWKDLSESSKHGAVAFIGSKPPSFVTHLPWFDRNDISGISEFILDHFRQQSMNISLKGLVLCGGYSTRMGKDKSLIDYHGQAQYQWAHQLLSNLGLETYLSCRQEQQYDLPSISDQFLNIGPLGGILSAMHQHPNTAFLTIAIDQPYLKPSTLHKLIQERQAFVHATCFIHPDNQEPEPLCCIYEPSFKELAFSSLAQNQTSPKQLLQSLNIKKVLPDSEDELSNINQPLSEINVPSL